MTNDNKLALKRSILNRRDQIQAERGILPDKSSLIRENRYLIFTAARSCGCVVAVSVLYPGDSVQKLLENVKKWLGDGLTVTVSGESVVTMPQSCDKCRKREAV